MPAAALSMISQTGDTCHDRVHHARPATPPQPMSLLPDDGIIDTIAIDLHRPRPPPGPATTTERRLAAAVHPRGRGGVTHVAKRLHVATTPRGSCSPS